MDLDGLGISAEMEAWFNLPTLACPELNPSKTSVKLKHLGTESYNPVRYRILSTKEELLPRCGQVQSADAGGRMRSPLSILMSHPKWHGRLVHRSGLKRPVIKNLQLLQLLAMLIRQLIETWSSSTMFRTR